MFFYFVLKKINEEYNNKYRKFGENVYGTENIGDNTYFFWDGNVDSPFFAVVGFYSGGNACSCRSSAYYKEVLEKIKSK